MNEHAKKTNVEPSTAELAKYWEAINSNRETLAKEIESFANNERGTGAKQLRVLSNWFGQSRSLDDALNRPDVLAVCLSLCRSGSPSFEKQNVRSAVRSGFNAIVHHSASSQQLVRAFFYPFLIAVAGILLGIGFCCFIAPQFDEMFDEFGIALPVVTNWILGVARFIRPLAWVFVFWLIAIAGLYWLLARIETRRRQSHLSWLDNRFLSSRDALAVLAWHLSLLLEAGVDQTQAIQHAGTGTGKAWLKQRCFNWMRRKNKYAPLLSQKFSLLNYALTIRSPREKIPLLREVSAYYRSRTSNFGVWFAGWLTLFVYWTIVVMALICVQAIFMPLIAIVSGLTGF